MSRPNQTANNRRAINTMPMQIIDQSPVSKPRMRYSVDTCTFMFPHTLLSSTNRNLPGKQSSACCAVATRRKMNRLGLRPVPVIGVIDGNSPRVRGGRGGDPRLLRLTMDGLLDRTCGERPRASRIGIVPRLDLPEDKVGPCNHRIDLWTNWDFGAAAAADECYDLIFHMKLCCEYRNCLRSKNAFGR